ncbi:flagellar hook-basal body protein [Ureibacillus chungkukjangi]|uniref:Flagellar basal-body rod protein FlgG n=1 Tax=Ureibacillus chungkukjangi TaxID=1202712 RepID=A0A318TSE6_9BACL|nr:flagellar hook-basal body protein [Ureibacillus chungkukjangi]PYF07554.1 flagellar basal-body rod protein FlgG [Ureibacillus chungkukjangi]
MFKGFYTVATGMVSQQRKTEIITNNMANANTPGFKSDQSTIRSFPDMLLSAVGNTNLPTDKQLSMANIQQIGSVNTGVYLQETLANYTQGSIYETSQKTDVALINGTMPTDAESGQAGSIFFRLEHPEGGEAYTRNGNFTLDGQGYLVNAQGLYVLSAEGERIQLPNDQYNLTEEGNIFVDDQLAASLGVSFSANPNTLMKQDNGLYRTVDGENLPTAFAQEGVTFSMQQSYLEGSNVDSAQSMTDLLTAYRAFEANQKVLQAYDKSMEKAVNEIGRV